jgi:hypothetical protein
MKLGILAATALAGAMAAIGFTATAAPDAEAKL